MNFKHEMFKFGLSIESMQCLSIR